MALVLVHGGAGPMRNLSGAQEAAYREGLRQAAAVGREALLAGKGALEAARAAVRSMEEALCFNAGLGSCLDATASYSLDAALMRGSDRAAGAVGALTATYRALDVAYDLLEDRHVFLVGEGADLRARALGLPPLPAPPADKLETFARLQGQASDRLEDLATVGRPDDALAPEPKQESDQEPEQGHDTVGAVALDDAGELAAAVSTGGLWLKTRGRVGDSPLIGAGLFACTDLGAAASSTGIGERLMRALSCYLACQIATERGAARGAREALADLERRFGSDTGGLIVVDRQGGVGVACNTSGMGRALARVGEPEVHVAVWPDEPFPGTGRSLS